MSWKIEKRVYVIQELLKGTLDKKEAAHLLKCSTRTISRFKGRFLQKGPEGLEDNRCSNYQKLTGKDVVEIKRLKREGPWRSARFIRDKLNLAVHESTVWLELKKAKLNRLNAKRLKPLQRFVAKFPNDLWQTDIMGRINFPYLGVCYLIATLDDHSRFCLSGKWFKRQTKINVFSCWYAALARWGLPKEMLQDRGSQYKARTRFGQADYQWYAQALGINLRWARRAETKGKIERFWRFVQQDFVRENLDVQTIDELNGRFRLWLAKYNYRFRSRRILEGKTRAEVYRPSERRASRADLQNLLVVEERRKDTRESTISLYGERYRVPPGYIGCRIWIKIRGNKVFFESMGEVFWKTRLKG